MPPAQRASEPTAVARNISERLLLEQAPACVLETDRLRSCLFANAAWRRASGLTAGQARGHGWRAAVHPADRDRLHGAWRAARTATEPVAADHRVVRPDGTVVWLAGAVAGVRDADGLFTGYLATWQDVTGRQDELTRRAHALRRLSESALAHLELDALLPRLAVAAREVLRAEGVAILLPEGDELVVPGEVDPGGHEHDHDHDHAGHDHDHPPTHEAENP